MGRKVQVSLLLCSQLLCNYFVDLEIDANLLVIVLFMHQSSIFMVRFQSIFLNR